MFTFCGVLFLTLMSDALLSYWVPNFLEFEYKNTAIVGLIISFSSIVGLAADLILPQVIRGITVKKLITISLVASILFSTNLFLITRVPWILLILLSMALWGIYYELLGFAQHQFVADTIPLKLHSATWGVLGVVRSTAYFVGPLVGAGLWYRSMSTPLAVAGFLSVAGIVLTRLSSTSYNRKVSIEIRSVNIISEILKWRVLLTRVWPLIAMSIFLGLVDSYFWSIGAVWNQKLSDINAVGGLFLPMYTFPTLFVGFIVARWQVFRGKKRKAVKFWIASSLVLSGLFVFENVYWQVGVVFVSSLFMSFAYPLLEGAYSDIIDRIRGEKDHMIGLTNSATSLSYIFGPAVAGFVASYQGEAWAISSIGWVSLAVGLVIYMVLPKKIRLPQTEIAKWKKEVAPGI